MTRLSILAGAAGLALAALIAPAQAADLGYGRPHAQGYPAQGYPAQGYPAQGHPAGGYHEHAQDEWSRGGRYHEPRGHDHGYDDGPRHWRGHHHHGHGHGYGHGYGYDHRSHDHRGYHHW